MFKIFVKDPPTKGKDIEVIPEISYDYINKRCVLRAKITTVTLPFYLVKVLYKTIIKSEEMNINQ